MDPLVRYVYFGAFYIIVTTVVGYLIGKPKGLETAGMLLGLFLGLIGLIVILVLPGERPQAGTPRDRLSGGNLPPHLPESWQQQAEREMALVRSRFSAGEGSHAPAVAEGNPESAKLKKLSELLEQGLITVEEHATKRQQVLDAI